MATTHHPDVGRVTHNGVLLDVGNGYGAIVVHAHSSWFGAEIEVSPCDEPSARQHVEVRERTVPTGHLIHSAVFGSLRQGDYVLWPAGGHPSRRISVRSGAVTEVTLGPGDRAARAQPASADSPTPERPILYLSHS